LGSFPSSPVKFSCGAWSGVSFATNLVSLMNHILRVVDLGPHGLTSKIGQLLFSILLSNHSRKAVLSGLKLARNGCSAHNNFPINKWNRGG
jgi:hypothetical protein